MESLVEGDDIYIRPLGSRCHVRVRVIEIAEMEPEPLVFLSNGESLPLSSLVFFKHNVKAARPIPGARSRFQSKKSSQGSQATREGIGLSVPF